MRRKRTSYPIKWTKEACLEAAKQCVSLKEFEQTYNGAYKRALKQGWLNDIVFPIPRRCTHRSDDEIISVAKLYTTLSDFYRKERNFYGLAHRRGLLQTFTWLKRKYDNNHTIHDAVYVYEFKDTKTAYVGRTIDTERRHNEHKKDIRSAVYQYAHSQNIEIPTPRLLYTHLSIKDGQRLEAETIQNYTQNGWVLLNKAPTGSVGSLTEFSKSECVNIAKRYIFKKDLANDYPKIYAALQRHNWLKECIWLKSYKRRDEDITYGQFVAVASKYKSRSDFAHSHHALYDIGRERGWVDSIFPAKLKPKPVIQYDLNGTLIAEYASIGEAARVTGCDTDRIIACCKHRQRHTHHYKFEYKESV